MNLHEKKSGFLNKALRPRSLRSRGLAGITRNLVTLNKKNGFILDLNSTTGFALLGVPHD